MGAMLDELRSLDRVPRSTRRMNRELEATVARLRQELGRQPTETERADAMNMTPQEYQQAVDRLRGSRFGAAHDLDVTDDDWEQLSAISIDDSKRPDTQLERTEIHELLAHSRARLPAREQKIMCLCYDEGLTLKETAEMIGKSESRVSQLRALAVTRLRVSMREALGDRA